MNFGEKIKKVRNKKKMSLRALAEKVNLSASFLSQIEQGKASPSIENLKKIANELEVKVSFLIDEESKKDTVITRAKDRNRMESLGSKTDISLLTNPDVAKNMEPIYYEVKPGGESGKDFYHHPGEEFVFIIEGELDIYLEMEQYRLEAGDSVYFKSTQKHKFVNNSDKIAKAIWVVTPPTF